METQLNPTHTPTLLIIYLMTMETIIREVATKFTCTIPIYFYVILKLSDRNFIFHKFPLTTLFTTNILYKDAETFRNFLVCKLCSPPPSTSQGLSLTQRHCHFAIWAHFLIFKRLGAADAVVYRRGQQLSYGQTYLLIGG